MTGSVEVNPARVNAAWSRVARIVLKLGNWAAAQIENFVTGLTTEGGKAIGKSLPYLIGMALEAWLRGTHAGELIAKLLMPH